MEILSSRVLLRPADLDQSRRFHRDVLGMAVYREFGPAGDPGVVFFLGQGLLEVCGHAAGPSGGTVMIWLHPPEERWGLTEIWIEDPDGVRTVLVEVPAGHPRRRDPR